MEEISKYKVVKAMVRGFFEGFFSGLIDSKTTDEEKKCDVIFVKQIVADNYNYVSVNFVNVVFPLLLAMNFDDCDAVVADMKRRHIGNETPAKVLLRYSCGSKLLYDIVVAEYKMQMQTLLTGHIQYPNDHIRCYLSDIIGAEQSYPTNLLDVRRSLRAVVRAQIHSYSLGIKASATGKVSFHQSTVLRMVINGMATLFHDEPLDLSEVASEKGLDGVYRKVTIKSKNYETLINEMNQAYEDLAVQEGIVSMDD